MLERYGQRKGPSSGHTLVTAGQTPASLSPSIQDNTRLDLNEESKNTIHTFTNFSRNYYLGTTVLSKHLRGYFYLVG